MMRISFFLFFGIILSSCGTSTQVNKPVNNITEAAFDLKCRELRESFIQKIKINERQLRVLSKDDGRKLKPKFIDDDIKFPIRVEIDNSYVSGYSLTSLEFNFLITAAQMNLKIPLREVIISANIMDENDCRKISNSLYECYLSQKKLSRLLAHTDLDVNGYDILHQSTFSIKVRAVYEGVITTGGHNTPGETLGFNCGWRESGYWSNYTEGFLFDCNAY
jgi:hypothetical protein